MPIVLKTCGLGMVFICASSVGIAMASLLTRRVQELETSISVLSAIESEFSYNLASPAITATMLSKRDSLITAEYLGECSRLCDMGVPFPIAWKKAVAEKKGALENQDVSILLALSETLGQSDLEGQCASLFHSRELLQLQLDSARAKSETHGRLYRTLGVLGGAFLTIVLM